MRKFVFLTILLVALTWSVPRACADTLDLKDFGAIGDGHTDDGPALQRALDALANAGGGTLFIPEGRYAILTPVHKDFSGLASSVTILGVESSTLVDNSGDASILAHGLDLVSELAPMTGETGIALSVSGLQYFLIKDIGFIGAPDIPTDAALTLAVDQVADATISHCEFYGLANQSQGGAIVRANRSRLTIAGTKFLGCTGNSSVNVPVVQILRWTGITVSDSTFLDYGLRPELYGKTGIGTPYSWINVGNAEAVSNDSPRREVVIDNVFLDEGALVGIFVIPHFFEPVSAPVDLVSITRLQMNVSNLNWSGNFLFHANAVLIEKSRYQWSHNADAAINLNGVGTAIIDEVECVDGANRIRADATTNRLSVINSVYTFLDSEAANTEVIKTNSTADDPVQYVRQQFETVLQRAPDPAAHFYWSNRILRCGSDALCLSAARSDLDSYLSSAPALTFSISGRVTDPDGNPLSDQIVSLSGAQAVESQTDADGRYRFSNLPTSGAYTVATAKEHFTFIEPSVTFTTPSNDQTVDFSAELNKYSIGGQIVDGNKNGIAGVTVALGGAMTATTITNSEGQFSFENLPALEAYTVTPWEENHTFQPSSWTINELTAEHSGEIVGIRETHVIQGSVARPDGSPLSGVQVNLSGFQTAQTSTDPEGNYLLANVPAGGDYLISVSKTNYSFAPPSQALNDLSATEIVDFTGALQNYTLSGCINVSGAPLRDVTITLSGSAGSVTTTDAGGNYSFSVTAEGDYEVTPSSDKYTFNPTSVVITNLSGNKLGDFAATLKPGVPVLISEANSTRALVFDSVLQTREPFPVNYIYPWAPDRRIRLMLFAMNFGLGANETATAVTAEAEDGGQRIYPLPVEYVGAVPGMDWLTCIVVRLDDELGEVGDILVGVKYHGVSSNRVRIGIGHIGGGPPDDPGAVPTPGRIPQ